MSIVIIAMKTLLMQLLPLELYILPGKLNHGYGEAQGILSGLNTSKLPKARRGAGNIIWDLSKKYSSHIKNEKVLLPKYSLKKRNIHKEVKVPSYTYAVAALV